MLNSVNHVQKVSGWLQPYFEDVVVPDTQVRPNIEDRGQYADDGDIIVGGRMKVEVKERRNVNFTSPSDYPWPTIIVDVTHRPLSDFYVITTLGAKHALVIPGSCSSTWSRKTLWDRVKGRHREFWLCPREQALAWQDGLNVMKTFCCSNKRHEWWWFRFPDLTLIPSIPLGYASNNVYLCALQLAMSLLWRHLKWDNHRRCKSC